MGKKKIEIYVLVLYKYLKNIANFFSVFNS